MIWYLNMNVERTQNAMIQRKVYVQSQNDSQTKNKKNEQFKEEVWDAKNFVDFKKIVLEWTVYKFKYDKKNTKPIKNDAKKTKTAKEIKNSREKTETIIIPYQFTLYEKVLKKHYDSIQERKSQGKFSIYERDFYLNTLLSEVVNPIIAKAEEFFNISDGEKYQQIIKIRVELLWTEIKDYIFIEEKTRHEIWNKKNDYLKKLDFKGTKSEYNKIYEEFAKWRNDKISEIKDNLWNQNWNKHFMEVMKSRMNNSEQFFKGLQDLAISEIARKKTIDINPDAIKTIKLIMANFWIDKPEIKDRAKMIFKDLKKYFSSKDKDKVKNWTLLINDTDYTHINIIKKIYVLFMKHNKKSLDEQKVNKWIFEFKILKDNISVGEDELSIKLHKTLTDELNNRIKFLTGRVEAKIFRFVKKDEDEILLSKKLVDWAIKNNHLELLERNRLIKAKFKNWSQTIERLKTELIRYSIEKDKETEFLKQLDIIQKLNDKLEQSSYLKRNISKADFEKKIKDINDKIGKKVDEYKVKINKYNKNLVVLGRDKIRLAKGKSLANQDKIIYLLAEKIYETRINQPKLTEILKGISAPILEFFLERHKKFREQFIGQIATRIKQAIKDSNYEALSQGLLKTKLKNISLQALMDWYLGVKNAFTKKNTSQLETAFNSMKKYNTWKYWFENSNGQYSLLIFKIMHTMESENKELIKTSYENEDLSNKEFYILKDIVYKEDKDLTIIFAKKDHQKYGQRFREIFKHHVDILNFNNQQVTSDWLKKEVSNNVDRSKVQTYLLYVVGGATILMFGLCLFFIKGFTNFSLKQVVFLKNKKGLVIIFSLTTVTTIVVAITALMGAIGVI